MTAQAFRALREQVCRYEWGTSLHDFARDLGEDPDRPWVREQFLAVRALRGALTDLRPEVIEVVTRTEVRPSGQV